MGVRSGRLDRYVGSLRVAQNSKLPTMMLHLVGSRFSAAFQDDIRTKYQGKPEYYFKPARQ